jgi:nucleoside phosphorylase
MQSYHRSSYLVGIVCALPIEAAAVQALFDEPHESLEQEWDDLNHYAFGRIGKLNVVVACLPSGFTGKMYVVLVASHMKRSFGVKWFASVGVAGGCPTDGDVQLGDVIVCDQGAADVTTASGEIKLMSRLSPPGLWWSSGVSMQKAARMLTDCDDDRLPNDAFCFVREAGAFVRPDSKTVADGVKTRSPVTHYGGVACLDSAVTEKKVRADLREQKFCVQTPPPLALPLWTRAL